jgi:hypothetical protein
MARGWESKNVEAQQAERERPADRTQGPADPARATRRKGLELARARVAADLEAATNVRHRAMLEAALADLDRQIRDL